MVAEELLVLKFKRLQTGLHLTFQIVCYLKEANQNNFRAEFHAH